MPRTAPFRFDQLQRLEFDVQPRVVWQQLRIARYSLLPSEFFQDCVHSADSCFVALHRCSICSTGVCRGSSPRRDVETPLAVGWGDLQFCDQEAADASFTRSRSTCGGKVFARLLEPIEDEQRRSLASAESSFRHRQLANCLCINQAASGEKTEI